MVPYLGAHWYVATVEHRRWWRFHWRVFVLENGFASLRIREHTFREILRDAGIMPSVDGPIPKVDAV
jgi:hypothetical protein